MKIKSALSILGILAILVSETSTAEPTTSRVKIVSVRPYNGLSTTNGIGGEVYITINQPALCGTSTYYLFLGWGGAKETFAVATAALLTQQDVQIEVAGCDTTTPWMTRIQSIYLLQ